MHLNTAMPSRTTSVINFLAGSRGWKFTAKILIFIQGCKFLNWSVIGVSNYLAGVDLMALSSVDKMIILTYGFSSWLILIVGVAEILLLQGMLWFNQRQMR